MTVAQQARAALHAGNAAAESGHRPTNPYDGNSTDPAERVRAKMWRTGYQAGNPMPRG
jgi:hypothetical protein